MDCFAVIGGAPLDLFATLQSLNMTNEDIVTALVTALARATAATHEAIRNKDATIEGLANELAKEIELTRALTPKRKKPEPTGADIRVEVESLISTLRKGGASK